MKTQKQVKKQIKLINLASFSPVEKEPFCPTGTKERVVYKYVYDERYGCPRRVVSGSFDQDDYIQQSADDVDFKTIGQMLVDTKANISDHFISKDGVEIDITGTPRNIHEAVKQRSDLIQSFDSLPGELKAVFNNSFDEFAKSYRTGQLGSKIETYYKSLEPAPQVAPQESEVK